MEPIGDDPRAGIQGRLDLLVQMVDPRRREKQRFRFGTEALEGAGQQSLADQFGGRRAAGFAGADRIHAGAIETRDERLRLRRFSAALPALDGDEGAARTVASPARCDHERSTYLRIRPPTYSSPASSARFGSDPTGTALAVCNGTLSTSVVPR